MIIEQKRILKWGNSMAVRLSSKIMATTRMNENEEIDVLQIGETVIINPASKKFDKKTLNVLEALLGDE